jgi:hypothetical protein
MEKIMADGPIQQIEATIKPPEDSASAWRILAEPLSRAIAAGCLEALKRGVPAQTILEIHLNQLTYTLAMIEPAGAREEAVKDIIRHIAPMTSRYVEARNTTPGGVILPREAAR